MQAVHMLIAYKLIIKIDFVLKARITKVVKIYLVNFKYCKIKWLDTLFISHKEA